MLSHHGDEDKGILSYMELTDLKFIPRRMYYITKVPKGEVRGNHGHREDQQYMFCVQGQIKVRLITKEEKTELILNPGDVAYMDRNTWGEQEYMTGNDILLVLCSTKHDPDDYITDINEILGDK
tara:strand:+ start:59650 stop:60021 length:372 start_codon:yes stop_codon:yes gene_type:complete